MSVSCRYSQILMTSIMCEWREDHILVRKYHILLAENTIFNIYDVYRNNARYQKNIKQLLVIKCTGKRCFFCHKKFLNKLRKFTFICKKYLSWKSKVRCTADIIIFFSSETFITIYFAIKIQWIPFFQFLIYAILKRWNKRLMMNIYEWHCMKLWVSMYQN